MPRVLSSSSFPRYRTLALALLGAALLSGCATNSESIRSPDFSGLDGAERQSAVDELGARYEGDPGDRANAIYYAAALRSAGQGAQAVAVIEAALATNRGDGDLNIAYAKALISVGRLEQALSVVDSTIVPEAPDWNALSVKGAILDQMGRNSEARQLYLQAQLSAPAEASLEANLGLSYAMTNDLSDAERHLRRAVQMQGANSTMRQNLALVVGLQGRFDECRALYAAELPPQEVEANLAYVRSVLTQQNRWQAIEAGT